MSVCIAIPTYMREAVLIESLNQVFSLGRLPDEVIVVDQTPGHEVGTERFLEQASFAGKIRWIKQATANLPMARNRALRESSSDVVIFIDDDVVLCQGFVGEHLKNYEDPKVIAVSGCVVEERHINSVPKEVKAGRSVMMDYRNLQLYGQKKIYGIARMGGCNHSVRRKKVLELGGYDENYIGTALGEDADLAIRIVRSGGVVVYDPEAELEHLMSSEGGCRIKVDGKQRPEWMLSFSEIYFFRKHFFPGKTYWQEVFVKKFRKYVLRRDNVFKPWRLPWAFASYLYSIVRAGVANCKEKGMKTP